MSKLLVEHWLRSILPASSADRYQLRLIVFRILALTTVFVGTYYLVWRYTSTLNYRALWFAIPLLLAETYSYIDTLLFVFMMWKPPRRVAPPPLPEASVDVFITTYNEPPELVRLTVEAALRIDWPDLKVYVLDDGNRPEMERICRQLGAGYITRGEEWKGKPRHAKAGNINNALLQTSGEFILVLDADQIPHPAIIRRIIGYFRDPQLAFVQTPQYFYNIPPGDPFGVDAPLFYGPILQGKDGWNAAFFCGSNALLRREALIQLGLTEYVKEMEKRVRQGLDALDEEIAHLPPAQQARMRQALEEGRRAYRQGQPLTTVYEQIRQALDDLKQQRARQELQEILESLSALAEQGNQEAASAYQHLRQHLEDLSGKIDVDIQALGISEAVLQQLKLTRSEEAQPILPLATISITEDMATAMRLHALGWKSVFHPEILAYGLAPEDLGAALQQRLRWAQGTIQVFVRENPFFKKGLTWPQRLQYFTTMYSYFSGFFSLIYVLSPIIYLLTGIPPVSAWTREFLWRLIPYLILNKILFYYVAWGIDVRRGEQYSLALFPLWIRAVITVLTGAKLRFVVTPKQRQSGNYLPLVWPQLLVIWLTSLAILYGVLAFALGWNQQWEGLLVNIFWGCYNILMLSAVVRAAVYEPPAGWKPAPPAFLFSSHSAPAS